MDLANVLLLSIAVAADAFAVALCKGVTIKNNINKNALIVGLWFGLFQGVMPLIGYFFMDNIEKYIIGIKEFIIFGLLCYIGISMIVEAKQKETFSGSVVFKEMLGLSISTSLDALSIGATLSIYKMNVYLIVTIIGFVTFLFSFVAVKIGNKFGDKYKEKAEITGGVILVLIGLKVLLEYLL